MAASMQITNFKGSGKWTTSFMKRNNLFKKCNTKTDKKLLDDNELKQSNLISFINQMAMINKFEDDAIINLDEFPINVYIPMDETFCEN
ncbi:hypothetical protein BLOT_008791 [Blomia tropicalis]|nr:hypothetical protein BLOT_008791 [Blomia tropicalis]